MKSPRARYVAGLVFGILLMLTPVMAFMLNILTVQHAFESPSATPAAAAATISRNLTLSAQSIGAAVLGLVLMLGSIFMLVRRQMTER